MKYCAICGKPAIGQQLLGCCCVEVCEEHADRRLRSLSPGESMASGEVYLSRYANNHDVDDRT